MRYGTNTTYKAQFKLVILNCDLDLESAQMSCAMSPKLNQVTDPSRVNYRANLLLTCQFKRYRQVQPGRVAQSVGHPTHKSGVLGSIPGLATYFRFSFRFFKKGSCQLLAKVCARSTGKPLRRSKPAQEKCG